MHCVIYYNFRHTFVRYWEQFSAVVSCGRPAGSEHRKARRHVADVRRLRETKLDQSCGRSWLAWVEVSQGTFTTPAAEYHHHRHLPLVTVGFQSYRGVTVYSCGRSCFAVSVIKRSSVSLSVRPSRRSTAAAVAGRFAAEFGRGQQILNSLSSIFYRNMT